MQLACAHVTSIHQEGRQASTHAYLRGGVWPALKAVRSDVYRVHSFELAGGQATHADANINARWQWNEVSQAPIIVQTATEGSYKRVVKPPAQASKRPVGYPQHFIRCALAILPHPLRGTRMTSQHSQLSARIHSTPPPQVHCLHMLSTRYFPKYAVRQIMRYIMALTCSKGRLVLPGSGRPATLHTSAVGMQLCAQKLTMECGMMS